MLKAAILTLAHLLLLGAVEHSPRLRFTPTDLPHLDFQLPQKFTVHFHDQGSDSLYIGATGSVLLLSFNETNVSQKVIPLFLDDNTMDSCKSKAPPNPDVSRAQHLLPIPNCLGKMDVCKNVITVIQRLNSSTIIVCGTHAENPICWFLRNNATHLAKDNEGHQLLKDGKGILSPSPLQRSITITVEGSLYSAISDTGGSGWIQRSFGRLRNMKTDDKWFHNPRFVGSTWVKAEDSNMDEVYFFFSETESSTALIGDPFKSRIGRVCKVDEGAAKNTPDSWSTFLKARLVCGFPEESKYFNRIIDAFVLHVEDNPRKGIVYGIFSSLWNFTAICAFSQADIEAVFKNPKLKGFTGSLPANPKPGKCTTGNIPKNVLAAIRSYPEIEEAINEYPLYFNKQGNYTKVTADNVKGANQKFYQVLFVGMGNGKIHKVLDSNSKIFIISELSLFKNEGPISSMTLDSSTGYLFVGTPLETVRLPLANCEEYGSSCQQCVAARDPYCGWDQGTGKCVPVSEAVSSNSSVPLQSVEQLDVSLCYEGAGDRMLDGRSQELTVDSGTYLYLPCPVKSYHAVYTWSYNQKEQFNCTIRDGSCTLFFNGHLPTNGGLFQCLASEDGLKEVVAIYNVRVNGGSSPALAIAAVLFALVAACALI